MAAILGRVDTVLVKSRGRGFGEAVAAFSGVRRSARRRRGGQQSWRRAAIAGIGAPPMTMTFNGSLWVLLLRVFRRNGG